MNPFTYPVSLNETSLKIGLLHKALKLLGFPVSEDEEKSNTAGESTLKQVRAWQEKLNLKYDDNYMVDKATSELLMEEMIKAGYSGRSNAFAVRGTVYNQKGEVVKHQQLIALDVDLYGAGVFRSVTTIEEIEKNGGFDYLGEMKSDLKGNYYLEFYSFQFAAKERKKADVIVYAVDKKGEITGRSKIVNSEEYSGKGEVSNLDIVITKNDERTEYEILMGKLLPFLEESKVRLTDLSNDQVKFLSGELDENASKIQLAVDAELLRTGDKEKCNCDKLLHELLYGTGRQGISLNWILLYQKTAKELVTAIDNSVKQRIIKAYNAIEIALFLQIIHDCAAAYILSFKDENQPATLEKKLSIALPEKEQQLAFVAAYRNFKNESPENEEIKYDKFWGEYLPAVIEFKEKPELISALLLSQQLTIISSNHFPLVEELQVNQQISSVIQLMDFDENDWKKIIKKTGVPQFITGENEQEKIDAYANQVQTLLNAAYPTQRIEVMLKKLELPIKDTDTIKGIGNFISANNKFDFSHSRIHEFEEQIKAAAPSHFEQVNTELMRMQRVFQVSPTPKVMGVLMENNLNSAYTIAGIPKKSFIKMHSEALGGDKMAEAVYQRAEHISTMAAERSMKLYDLSHSPSPGHAYSGTDQQAVWTLLSHKIPNYSKLFGSPDICECEHCRSVYSPAAYFVELLRFLWRSGKNDNGQPPLEIFASRRPDLLHLPLTCENTNTIIPYIDLVNEVMEFYASYGNLYNAAYDTGKATADELRANPQNFKLEAYLKLNNDAVYPFSLPYHQPLDVIRTYSDHLKTERYEVMKAMQNDFTNPVTIAIESESLRISEEEFTIFTKQNFRAASDTRALYEYFGYESDTKLEKMAGTGVEDGIHEFLRRTGIKYIDLVELIKTKFINPYQGALEYLEDLFTNSTLTPSTIYKGLAQIAGNGGTEASAVISSLPVSIQPADFTAWVKNNFKDFNAVITLYQSDSKCDLNTTCLRTVQNVYAGTLSSGITVDTWSKIHRFIRLWRKLGWTIHEVDLMLSALGDRDITPDTIHKLSYTVLLNKELKLPIDKLATLWGSIDNYGDKSLYKKLFLNKAVQRIDTAFQADNFGKYLSNPNVHLREHLPAILAAFRMSEADLNSIIETATITDNNRERRINPDTDQLNIHYLSLIYRYTLLSKALKLSVPDFCLLSKLFSNLPFSNLIISSTGNSVFNSISPADTFKFYELSASIKKSGFKPSPLQYIFTGTLPADSRSGLSVEKAMQAASVLRNSFNTIEQTYPSIPSAPLTIDILKNNLLLSFKAEVVNELIDIIGIRQSFSLSEMPNLSVSFHNVDGSKYRYSAVTGTLTCWGIMTDSERIQISDSQRFSVPTARGYSVIIPAPLSRKFSFVSSVSGGSISCTGIMTGDEKAQLSAITGIPDDFRIALNNLEAITGKFKNSIESLFNNSNAYNKTAKSYSVVIDPNLVLSIPDWLSPKLAYTKSTGKLSSIGIMSQAEFDWLNAVRNDSFNNGIQALYKMPEDFIKANFSSVFAATNLNPSTTDILYLLNRNLQTEKTLQEKVQFVYSNYLPLLKNQLLEAAFIQQFANLIGLSEEITTALIKNDKPAFNALTKSISLEGFSAEYFNNNAYTGSPALSRIDKEINFDWKAAAPVNNFPVDNFSVRWKSFIAPPLSGDYTLIVEVKGADEAFELWVDDALILNKPAGHVLTSWQTTVGLNVSQMYKLELKYAEGTGNAGISLSWKTSTTSKEIISAAASFPAGSIEDFISTARIYHRAAQFICGFKLTDKEVNHFIKYKIDFDNINLKAITPTHWKRISDYVQLRNAIPQSQASLTDVFVAANIAIPAPPIDFRDKLIDIINLATGWDKSAVTYLVKNHFKLLTPEKFRNEISLLTIYEAVSFVLKTGLSAETLVQWASPATDFDDLNRTADLVKNTVKAKYEEEDWLKHAGNLSDKIRENQKQALISYLLTNENLIKWGVKDADGLFEYFLIDVQMGVCMDTSRIVQASAAVQMFVNRCLLNLESNIGEVIKSVTTAAGTTTTTIQGQIGISPGAIDEDRWEWMKYYRVWEANRKIFLYPENWLEPEWRDDRSPFFKELESELTQNDITDRSVETAFRNYLTKLNTVANLDVCGVYQETYPDGKRMKMLHVFGRTHNAPYQFFYRTCDKDYKWAAWEKVPVDIRMTEDGDNSGVHLVPVVWKSRLFIFWAEFIKKQAENVPKKADGQPANVRESAEKTPGELKAPEYYEIRLAWSEYVDGKWNPKQLTKEFVEIELKFIKDSLGDIILKTNILKDALYIIPYSQFITTGGNSWTEHDYFKLSDIQSQVLTVRDVDTTHRIFDETYQNALKTYHNNFEKHRLKTSKLEFWGKTYLRTPNDYDLIWSNNVTEKEIAPDAPFFYSDVNRTYFVRKSDKAPNKLVYPERTPPILIIALENESNSNSNLSSIHDDDDIKAIDRNKLELSPIGKAFEDLYGNNSETIIDLSDKKFEFHTFYHPYSSQFVSNLNQDGIKGLMDSDTKLNSSSQLYYNDSGKVFNDRYNPDLRQGLKAPTSNDYKAGEAYTYYKENICFDVYGANSLYNWELFFHAPLYIATRLSKNGKFEEAMKWFHYIFDPTTDKMPLKGQSETSRYWNTLPFKTTPAQTLEEWFDTIGLGANTNATVENSIVGEWRDNPFKPFVIARNRPIAFMKNVVIKYVENLRAWGDSLFRTFTRESVNEALQLYVIANHILGPRPESVPKRGEIKAETYDSLKDRLDDFSNALVEMENIFPYSSSVSVIRTSASPGLLGIGKALYFCIPSNEKLIEHWDTIADRLYKIRHCMDIDGVERHLALFSPPIDPAMLVNAAAQGISLGSILSDLSSPPPIYRFNYLMQKANEFCVEVKSLGSNLLSTLEKKDSEELGRLRASHETSMLDLMTAIKEKQVYDAKVNREGLLKTRETAKFRFEHYNALLSDETISLPEVPTINGEVDSQSDLPVDISINEIKTGADESLVDGDARGIKIIQNEKDEMDKSIESKWWLAGAGYAESLAGMLNMIVQGEVKGSPFGVGAGVVWGGLNLGSASSAVAAGARAVGQFIATEASQSARVASYIRREQDWAFQANLAAKEIIQLDKQIVSAEIKIQIAKKELSNHKQQIENSKEVEQYLKNKFTNQELYQWMKEQLFSIYKQSYNIAYDMAKRVEKCYRYELGNEITNFIQYGYWDNTVQGLCAGEKLQLALRQMEKSYVEENKRELELTKSVSMALINPLALQELRSTGKCFLTVPEELYDLDYQGHYFRRIKSVSLSLPCIAGPYTTVNCTLRLLKNAVRINTSMNDESGNYEHANEEGLWTDDPRFRESSVPVKAISTSTGQRDSGMFELSFRDERYLPFEGAGAISEWKIELTKDIDLRQFDYATISDVILHISYTAREDAGLFKEKAVTYLKNFLMNVSATQPLMRMFSIKHDFSTEWHKFLHPAVAGSDQVLSLNLRKEHFPFFTKDRVIHVEKIEVLMKANRTGDYQMRFSAVSNTTSAPTEISMPESVTYGNMQKGTLNDTAVSSVEVNHPMSFKFKHISDADFHSIDTNPDEISDLFIVFYYALGN